MPSTADVLAIDGFSMFDFNLKQRYYDYFPVVLFGKPKYGIAEILLPSDRAVCHLPHKGG